jgi:dGTPase
MDRNESRVINDMFKLPRTKDMIETSYSTILAPFATHKPKENSRVYSIGEEIREHENRASFQRDRDRIIHSKAFRRLMYKTQVFVNHEGDHFRTRLTHTLEVAQLARGICKSLALNEDLAEAIALGHDLGHTPFGHAVEGYLDSELKNISLGEFYHNEQSVRIVDFIEKRCDEYSGLNLTTEVREGILKHNGDYSGIYKDLNPGKICSSLEGQIVGLVDTIAYICHDLQDGIESGLINKAMRENVSFKHDFDEIIDLINTLVPDISLDFVGFNEARFVNKLIHQLVMSITEQSVLSLEEHRVSSLLDVENLANNNIAIIKLKEQDKRVFQKIKKLVYKSVYGLNTIQIMDKKAINLVEELFQIYKNSPELLPPDILHKYNTVEEQSKYDNQQDKIIYTGAVNSHIRVIIDYIACMTDRSALEEHERLMNPRIKI